MWSVQLFSCQDLKRLLTDTATSLPWGPALGAMAEAPNKRLSSRRSRRQAAASEYMALHKSPELASGLFAFAHSCPSSSYLRTGPCSPRPVS